MDTGKDIEDALVAFVNEHFLVGMDDVDLQPDDDLLVSGFVDSLGVMRIVRHIEDHYEVRVPPADITLENFLTVRRMGAYVRALQEASSGVGAPQGTG